MSAASRFAVIDVGTNSVLLLVAERAGSGHFTAVLERAQITRLGKGVDQTRSLSDESMAHTLSVLEAYAKEARELGAQEIVATGTSAARDASNGPAFIARVQRDTGVRLEVLSGDEEARLSFESVALDAPLVQGASALVVIDIGGGSTELVYGEASGARVGFKHSFNVGSVRLFERFVKSDPPDAQEQDAARELLRSTFAALPTPPAGARLVGVAGTVTTVLALARKVHPYDVSRIHGHCLERSELEAVMQMLFRLPVSERQKLPGLQPKRADVIPLGALILYEAMDRLGAEQCWVSDRGLRWGVLQSRFRL